MKREHLKVIARTTDENIFVVRAGRGRSAREYLETEHHIPKGAFPSLRYRGKVLRPYYLRKDLPLSGNVAFNSELYPKDDCIRIFEPGDERLSDKEPTRFAHRV